MPTNISHLVNRSKQKGMDKLSNPCIFVQIACAIESFIQYSMVPYIYLFVRTHKCSTLAAKF